MKWKRKDHLQLGAFLLVHITTLVLYIASLGSDEFSREQVQVTYDQDGEYNYEQSWGLLGTRVPVKGGVEQAFKNRNNIKDFAYSECGSVNLPAECDAIRAAGVGTLILLLWAVVSAATTIGVAVHYRVRRQGPMAWVVLALFALIEATMALAASLLWLHSAQGRMRSFLTRLFLYDANALNPADLPTLQIHHPRPDHALYLALAGFILSALSIPLLFFIRRVFVRAGHEGDNIRAPMDPTSPVHRGPDLLTNPVLARIAEAHPDWTPENPPQGNGEDVYHIYPTPDESQPVFDNAGTMHSQNQSIGQSGTFRYNPPEIMNVKTLRAMNADQVSVWFDSMGLGDESVHLILRHDVSGRILLGAPPDSIRSAFGADADIILETLEQERHRKQANQSISRKKKEKKRNRNSHVRTSAC